MAIEEAHTTTGGRELEPIGNLMFENDDVAVWALELQPGDSTGWHKHDHPYLMIVLEGDSVVAEFDSDIDELEAPTPAGRVMLSDASINSPWEAENAHNRTATRFREIVVELKNVTRKVDYLEADGFVD
jgi:hypothetical protein